MSEVIISIGLLALYVGYVKIITHFQDKKIEKLESKQRDWVQIYKNQREQIKLLNQEIKELKEDIYINK